MQRPTITSPLEFAQLYAHREQLRVIPLHSFHPTGMCTCGQAQCSSPGKHPRTKDGVKSASSDLAQIAAWWQKHPQANVGIATGEGLLVVDIDPRHGGSLEALKQRVELPEPMSRVRTGGGGLHLYFRYDQGLMLPNTSGKLAEGIDTRGHHGYVVAPPSLHASGKRYSWVVGGEFPPAPAGLLELILNPRRAGSSHVVILPPQLAGSQAEGAAKDAPAAASTFVVAEGKRHSHMVRLAGSLRGQWGASESVLLLTLQAYNQAHYQPPLPDAEVIKIAQSAVQWGSSATVRTSGVDNALDMADLMAREPPPLLWIIPGLLAEGVTLLAGKPKTGKSFLGLQLGLGIADGTPALGYLPTLQGHVFYLGLEDTERRIKDRILKLMQGRVPPPAFSWAGEWLPLPAGGLDDLAAWVTSKPNPRLVIIDTLARIRPSGNSGIGSIYAEDYAMITPIKQLADDLHISVLLIHHLRKGGIGSNDPMDEISGSTGLTGATDCNMVLQRERGEMTAKLHITGRDVDEQQLMLSFDEQTALWSLMSDTAAGSRLTPGEQAIMAVLQEQGEAMSIAAVARALGKDYDSTRKSLARLRDKGLVVSPARGLYLPSVQGEPLWDLGSLDEGTPRIGVRMSESRLKRPVERAEAPDIA